ncbi:XdhC family protein [Paenibacillus sp. TAB 01]|uniref:XdhC family protein n=1 Tax=Paenibacillus sp. TAB 01 TaxID=3368988 RepID=UPI00374FEABB
MEMHDIVSALYSGPQSAVLATIIDVEGHAYRKRGAVMALWADGSVRRSFEPRLPGNGFDGACASFVGRRDGAANHGLRYAFRRRLGLGRGGGLRRDAAYIGGAGCR